MTAEEAIKGLKPIVDNEAYTDHFQDVCRTAIEALEKQIPKKLNMTLRGTTGWNTEEHCPVCQKRVYDSYCSGCGQAIDWGEE